MRRLGIHILHGRPHHPQTQGKVERFHRTLQTELVSRHRWRNLEECQLAFDAWRSRYNYERPHEALNLQPPAACYQASSRAFPDILPAIAYHPNDIVRKVDLNGDISFHNRLFHVGKAFIHNHLPVLHKFCTFAFYHVGKTIRRYWYVQK